MKQAEYDQWKEKLGEFREKTEAFYAGEIDKKEYKGFSGKYGSYAQRDGKAGMLRLRFTGGIITKDQLKFIADSIETHHIDLIHLTTCQTVQLHNLKPAEIYDIMERALEYEIVTMGGGGDYPRNVTMSPLSGVEEEYFDVTPYTKAAGRYLLGLIDKKKMPRKLKVAFSNHPENVSHATFRDLGFTAREDGTFDVYSAGGLGANPKFGLKVGNAVDPEKILYYIQAMWEVFLAYGNYENRAKARTRYMQQTLGEKGYQKVFQEKLQEVLASGEDLTLQVEKQYLTKTGDGTKASGRWVICQKQEGLYAFHYHPIGGVIHPSKFREIYDCIKNMDQVEIRLSPDESMYVINLTGSEIKKLEKVLEDGAKTLFEASVACIGASICQVGVRDSQKLLKAAVEAVRASGLPDDALPQIHISGCPSSCGTHQIGKIGFRGGVKIIDKVPNPAFNLFINGCDEEGREQLGMEFGTILEKDIPAFLVEVGKASHAYGKGFDCWMKEKKEELEMIGKKYIVG